MAAKSKATRTHVQDGIREMVRRIVSRFDPDAIILFGSRARGSARPESDVDLLVVMPVEGSRRRKQLEIRLALHDVAIAKDDANLVWVGTGENNNRQSVSWGNVVYKSTDGGQTCKHIVLRDSKHIARIIVDPIDHDVVYVAALGSRTV